jgi:hypothetical protein
MLEQFAEQSVLINEIESIADMDLRDIKCLINDEDDMIETMDKDGNYIWDTVGKVTSKTLEEVRLLLDSGYTAIPF